MPLIKCPMCEKMISPNAESCPYCGEPLKNNIIIDASSQTNDRFDLILLNVGDEPDEVKEALKRVGYFSNSKINKIMGNVPCKVLNSVNKDLTFKMKDALVESGAKVGVLDAKTGQESSEKLILEKKEHAITDSNVPNTDKNYETNESFFNKHKKDLIIMFVSLAILVFGVGGYDYYQGQKNPDDLIFKGRTDYSSEEEKEYDSSEIWTWSKHLVEKNLKSPKSADFPWFDESYINEFNGDTLVTSYVDAENGFGANIRVQFIVTFKGGDLTDYSVVFLE